MLNTFNPPVKNIDDMKQVVSNLGTFYDLLDNNSKNVLTLYFQELFTNAEALYYNVIESTESYDLNGLLPAIDLSYNDLIITKDTIKSELLKIPTISTVSVVGVDEDEEYCYYVSAVDKLGIETPISKGYVIDNGNTSLDVSNYNHIVWNNVEGAYKYIIYGRTIGSTYKIGEVNHNGSANSTSSFDDTGTSLISASPVDVNKAINAYIVDIPYDYYVFHIGSILNIDKYNSEVPLDTSDYEIINFKQLKFKDISIYNRILGNHVLGKTFAFNPILLNVYMKTYIGDDYLRILIDGTYTGYIDESKHNLDHNFTNPINNESEALAWSFHLNKLFHNLSLKIRHNVTINDIRDIMALVFNRPFAYTEGTVSDLIVGTTYTTFKIGELYYKVDNHVNLNIHNGDTVNKYQILNDDVAVKDAYSSTGALTPTNDFEANRIVKITLHNVMYNHNHHILMEEAILALLPAHLKVEIVGAL